MVEPRNFAFGWVGWGGFAVWKIIKFHITCCGFQKILAPPFPLVQHHCIGWKVWDLKLGMDACIYKESFLCGLMGRGGCPHFLPQVIKIEVNLLSSIWFVKQFILVCDFYKHHCDWSYIDYRIEHTRRTWFNPISWLHFFSRIHSISTKLHGF